MTELKSCPFCGGEAAHFALNEAVFKATWVSHVTHCTKCQARVQSLNSEASIILWNTRAAPPTEPVAAKTDLFKNALDAMTLYARELVGLLVERHPDELVPNRIDEILKDAGAKHRAAYAPPTPEGDFVLVPRAKLEEWRQRFLGYKADGKNWNYGDLIKAIDEMNAMIAAAPSPPMGGEVA